MCGSLFHCGGADPSDELQAVASMSSSMELAFFTLVLQLVVVLDAVSILTAVEAFITLWGTFASSTSHSFLQLLIIPH